MSLFEVTLYNISVLQTIGVLQSLNFSPFLNDSGQYVKTQIQDRMQRGESPEGGAYPANVGKYAKWKGREYPGKPPLTLTGELREKITTAMVGTDETLVTMMFGQHSLIPNYPAKWSQEPRDYFSIATKLERGGGDMPPRVFLAMNDLDVEEVFNRFVRIFEPELQ